MEKIILKAKKREGLGKNPSKHLRKEGQTPSVVYKDGKKGVNVRVDSKDLWRALHTDAGENAIITMDISGTDKDFTKTVIVKEVQIDPISEKFVHVDFHEISLKEKIKVKIPIALKGEAVGVSEEEGVLTQILWELEVECLPTNIPEHIDMDVEELRIGDALHVSDIAPIEGVEILDDPENMVASVNPPEAEEEEEEEAVEGEEAEEPEVIKKGKKEEEGEGEEEKDAGEKAESEG